LLKIIENISINLGVIYLGGELFKMRTQKTGQGKSGGFRTIFHSLMEEYQGIPFNIKLPPKETEDPNVSPEILNLLKQSVKKNHQLGELLAK